MSAECSKCRYQRKDIKFDEKINRLHFNLLHSTLGTINIKLFVVNYTLEIS
jgi:hypothetical protein